MPVRVRPDEAATMIRFRRRVRPLTDAARLLDGRSWTRRRMVVIVPGDTPAFYDQDQEGT